MKVQTESQSLTNPVAIKQAPTKEEMRKMALAYRDEALIKLCPEAMSIKSVRKFAKHGYMVVTYVIPLGIKNKTFDFPCALTMGGDYIGTPKMARAICIKRGIIPMTRTITSKTCSIGFCPKDGKWYGWSHRAIYGFKKGMVGKKGHMGIKPGYRLKSFEDSRLAAEAFASEVS